MNSLIVSYGGGINSLAMLVGMNERGLRPGAILFSDTRGEKPGTYQHMDYLAPWLEKNGFPPITKICRADFNRGKTGDLSLEDEMYRLSNVPSRAFGFGTCADKWKIDPMKWWLKNWPPAQWSWARGEAVVRAIGYDDGEHRRVGTTTGAWGQPKLVVWRSGSRS